MLIKYSGNVRLQKTIKMLVISPNIASSEYQNEEKEIIKS